MSPFSGTQQPLRPMRSGLRMFLTRPSTTSRSINLLCKISVPFSPRCLRTSTRIQASARLLGKFCDFVDVLSVLTASSPRLTRGPDGKFADDDIANILHNATENAAGAYRARGTPGVLRVIEILGIEQARQWGVCSMNEFRKFLGLKRALYQIFFKHIWLTSPCSQSSSRLKSGILIQRLPYADCSPCMHKLMVDMYIDIQGAARRLYGHIANLELYVRATVDQEKLRLLTIPTHRPVCKLRLSCPSVVDCVSLAVIRYAYLADPCPWEE